MVNSNILVDISRGLRNMVVVAVVAITASSFAMGQAQQLPIETYLDLLPVNFVQWWLDPVSGNVIYFDVAGKLNTRYHLNLGTTVAGKVTLRYLPDGTQQFTVTTHTTNALCWGYNSDFQRAFGYDPYEAFFHVGPPALGSGMTRAVYAPQPIGPLNRRWPVETIISNIHCEGLLRLGSGYPEGTEGLAQTTQTGLTSTGVPSDCPPEGDADCFPAEKVQFKPFGD